MDIIDKQLMAKEMIEEEGLECVVYDDATGLVIKPGVTVVGHPTIGVGRALDKKGLSTAEVSYLLSNDIAEYIDELTEFPWFMGMDPIRRRVIINMRHQLGLTGLLEFRNMIAYIAVGNWKSASAQGLVSKWANQTPSRALKMMAMLRTGISYIKSPNITEA